MPLIIFRLTVLDTILPWPTPLSNLDKSYTDAWHEANHWGKVITWVLDSTYAPVYVSYYLHKHGNLAGYKS